jgi:hypothetical protein
MTRHASALGPRLTGRWSATDLQATRTTPVGPACVTGGTQANYAQITRKGPPGRSGAAVARWGALRRWRGDRVEDRPGEPGPASGRANFPVMSIRRGDEEDRIGRSARRSAVESWSAAPSSSAAASPTAGGRTVRSNRPPSSRRGGTVPAGTTRSRGDGEGAVRRVRVRCVDPWTWRGEVHPAVVLLVAVPYLLSMGITGLTGFLAWDYRRDRGEREARLGLGRR